MSNEIIDPLNLTSTENDSSEHCLFDKIIGHIEDILMDGEFHSLQQYFLNKYWHVFEPIEENKLLYMEIFNEYHKAIETYIDGYLRKYLPTFSMDEFLNELQKRRNNLDGEVFEVLLTFTDFLSFKELLLDYRAVQEGKIQDLSSGIIVKPLNLY